MQIRVEEEGDWSGEWETERLAFKRVGLIYYYNNLNLVVMDHLIKKYL